MPTLIIFMHTILAELKTGKSGEEEEHGCHEHQRDSIERVRLFESLHIHIQESLCLRQFSITALSAKRGNLVDHAIISFNGSQYVIAQVLVDREIDRLNL